MTRSALPILALLAASMALAPAGAEGDVPVVVRVENGHDSVCLRPLAQACFATMEGEGGDAHVDAYQNFSYVGVAARTPPEVRRLIPLLPDEAVSFHADSLTFSSPHGETINLAAAALGRTPVPEHVGARSTRDNFSLSYPVVAWSDASQPPTLRPYYYAFSYFDDLLGHDRVGAPNTGLIFRSDPFIRGFHHIPCGPIVPPACRETLEPVPDRTEPTTPGVRLGLAFYETQVATDPDHLAPGGRGDAAPPADEPAPPVATGKDAHPLDPRQRPAAPSPQEPATRSLPRAPPPTQPRPAAAPPTLQAETSNPLPPGPDALPPAVLLAASATAAALGVVAYLLYTRFWRPKDVLESEARRALLALVTAEPGASPSTLAKRAGVARNTVVHHLHVLERAQLVRVVSEGRELFVFPVAAGPVPPGAGVPLRATRHPVSREILAVLQAHLEGLTRSEVHARMPAVPLRTLNYHVAKLVKEGLVASKATPGRADVLRLARAGADAPPATAFGPAPSRASASGGSAT